MNPTIKHEIVKKLMLSNGEPISGQQLADEFKISRTAIWKHMKELESEGYLFETVKKKGYVLKNSPDSVHPATIEPFLQTRQLGKNIIYAESYPSTQTIALIEAQNGVQSGTVVICEEQTNGRGRMAREWRSAARKGIWMSVILRPEIAPQQAPQFTLVTAVAVTKAIEDLSGCRPAIKWPNDLLVNGKKCTGILTELQADVDRVHALVIGIGINVNHVEVDFPTDIQQIATSLRLESGQTLNRSELVAKILYYLEKYTDLYIQHGFVPIKLLWESYSCTIGNRIRATTLNQQLEGKAIAITNDGVLQLQTDDGTIHGIYSADIEIQE